MRTDDAPAYALDDYKPYAFAIDQVRLVFTLGAEETRVDALMQVRRLTPGPLVLNGEDLTLQDIAIDGVALPADRFTVDAETLTVPDVPDAFALRTRVVISPERNTALSGLYVSGGRLCTQCEAHGFRRITYWPDRPDVMSRFSVRLEADKTTYPTLLSNGTPGEAGDCDGGRHFAEWDDPHPKPSYLFALCAGDYDVYRDAFTTASGRKVGLAVYVDKGDAPRAAYAMDALKRSMRWDEEVFGREYDLGVFNIVAVRDFNFGAMENKGLNIFNSAYVLADETTATDMDFEAIESIVAHEYFHNWTGNRITCRDWFQLCLKEGLTVFRDQEFSADMRSRPMQRVKDVIRLRARQFAEDAGPLAHPVRPDSYGSVDNLYTATVYEKGAELIRMLKTLIGPDAFSAGMSLYFDRHDGEAVTIEDFYACFEEAAARDLSGFRRWYAQAGTPVVTAGKTWDASTGTLTLSLEQLTPPTPGQPDKMPVPIPLKTALLGANGTVLEERLIVLEQARQDVVFDGVPETPWVSINRMFSAPIILNWRGADETSLQMASIENDPFNRWELLQQHTARAILDMANGSTDAPHPSALDAVAQAVSEASRADPAFASLLLRAPTVGELFQKVSPADAVALEAARNRWRAALAIHPVIETLGEEVLSAPSPTPFEPSAEQAGIRALRTAIIAGLGTKGASALNTLATLYAAATNMTEQLACLRSLIEAGGQDHPLVLAFHAQWADNPLIVDKWFGACAVLAKDTAAIDTLIAHPDFALGNPNRVRAVLGAFAMQNLAAFHAPDGSGHKLVSRLCEEIDARNPALAARLLTAFEQWRLLEPVAKASARAELVRLKAVGLSQNSADIINRSLGEETA
ncbi:MAG: aminopeptidase N [Pseudomonadota bacterium]